jgi:hypothetical protein
VAGKRSGSRNRTSQPGFDDGERGVRGFVFTATVLAVSFGVALLSQFGTGVVPDAVRGRLDAYGVVWPQSWTFFVGSLEKDSIVAYRVGADGRWARLRERQLWDSQLGGLNREYDARTSETWEIARRIPDQYWRPCTQRDGTRCTSLTPGNGPYALENPTRNPELCGTIAIAVEHAEIAGAAQLPDGPWEAARGAVVAVRCDG